MKITGIGNSVVDLFYPLRRGKIRDYGFEPGRRYHPSWQDMDELRKRMEPPHRMAGGSAANTIKLCALLGMEASLVMRTGLDPETQLLEEELKDNFVDLILDRVHGRTGICCTLLEEGELPTMVANPGVGLTLTPDQVPKRLLADSDILYLEGYLLRNRELIQDLIFRAKEAGTQVAVDLCCPPYLADAREELFPFLREGVDILFMNRPESMALTGQETPRDALKILAPLCSQVVIKLDKNGALASLKGEIYQKNTVEIQPTDSTGAGDAFTAGYLTGLSQGKDPRICCEMGHFLSTRIISRLGTRITQEALKEVQDAYLSMG